MKQPHPYSNRRIPPKTTPAAPVPTRHRIAFLIAMVALVVMTPLAQGQVLSYPEAVLASNPVAFYQTNETTGTVMINSLNPGTYDGTYVGVLLDQETPAFAGTSDASIHFSKNLESYARVHIPLFDVSTVPVTVEFLVKDLTASGTVGGNYLFSKGPFDTSTAQKVQIGVSRTGENDGKIYVRSAGDAAMSETFLGTDWAHIAFTYNRPTNAVTLYVNGTLVLSSTVTATNTNGDFYFGKRAVSAGGTAFPSLAYMSDIAIYDRILTGAEIQAHYQALAIPEPTWAGLLAAGGLLVLWRQRKKQS